MQKKVNIRFRRRELTVYFDTLPYIMEDEMCTTCQERISSTTLVNFQVLEGNKTLPIEQGIARKVIKLFSELEKESYDLCGRCMLDCIYELENKKDCAK